MDAQDRAREQAYLDDLARRLSSDGALSVITAVLDDPVAGDTLWLNNEVAPWNDKANWRAGISSWRGSIPEEVGVERGNARRLAGILRDHCEREGRPYDAIEKTTLGTLMMRPEPSDRAELRVLRRGDVRGRHA